MATLLIHLKASDGIQADNTPVTTFPLAVGGTATAVSGGSPVFRDTGGEKFIYFDDSGDKGLDLPNVGLGTTITVVLVARQNAGGDYGRILNADVNWLMALGREDGITFYNQSGVVASSPPEPLMDVKKLLVGITNTSQSKCFLDKTAIHSANTLTGIPGRIGIGTPSYKLFAASVDADIFELRIYTGELTTSELEEVENELALAYGLSYFHITTDTLPNATVGVPYANQKIFAAGAIEPFGTPTIVDGALPPNFSLLSSESSGIACFLDSPNPTTAGTYNFKIRSIDDEGNATVKAFTLVVNGGGDTTPPTVPTLSGTVVSHIQANLSWTAAFDAVGVTGYRLQRATNSAFTTGLQTFNLGNVLSYPDAALAPSTQYFWRVAAHDVAGNYSAYSNVIDRTTQPAPIWEGTKTFAGGGFVGIACEDSFVHVISGTGFDVGPIYYYRSSNEGSSWDIDGVNIATGIPYLEEPLCIRNGKIALFYFKNLVTITDFFSPREVGELFCRVSLDNGATWGAEKLVSGVVVPGRGYRVSACWSNSGLHVAWMDFKNVVNPNDPANQTTSWDLYYNRSLDDGATWQTEQRIAVSSNKTGENRPSICAIGDNVHLTWFRGIDGKGSCTFDLGSNTLPNCTEVFHQRNTNNGAPGSWATRTQLTDNLSPIIYSGRNRVTEIEPSTVFITFDRGQPPPATPANDIYAIRSTDNGATFQPEYAIVTSGGAQTHSGTVSKDARTHLIWGDYPTNSIYYKTSSNDGVTFGTTELVSSGIVGLIDATDNYVHVVGGATYRRRFLPPPDTEPPSIPTGLTGTVISTTQIDVFCNPSIDNVGVAGYNFQRATDVNFTQNVVNIPRNVPNWSDTGLTPNTNYYYRVNAHDGVPNTSFYSTTISRKTLSEITFLESKWSRMQIVPTADLEAWHALDLATDGTLVLDFSRKNRAAIALTNPPVLQQNVIGENSVLYFDGSRNPLVYSGVFPMRHVFCVCAYEDALFAGSNGILSDTGSSDGIFIFHGNPDTANFFTAAGYNATDYRKSDFSLPISSMAAPMGGNFAVLEILYAANIPLEGFQIGRDRQHADRKWKGWFLESLVYSQPKNDCERLKIYEYFAMKFFLWRKSAGGLDIFPFANNIKTPSQTFKNTLESTSVSGAFKGRTKSGILRSFDVPFTVRRSIQWDAAETFWDEHSNGVRCVLEDNSFYPRRQFTGRITTPIERDPQSINNVGYKFGFVTE